MLGPYRIRNPAKIPQFTPNGFLEETFYETLTEGVFVFNAKLNEVKVAVDSLHPKKRQRVVEVEPDEVIVIQRSKKRPKLRKLKRILKRRVSN